jgi:hypothetical protein
VTTVLTITTLLSSANNNLPATAYPKVREREKEGERGREREREGKRVEREGERGESEGEMITTLLSSAINNLTATAYPKVSQWLT